MKCAKCKCITAEYIEVNKQNYCEDCIDTYFIMCPFCTELVHTKDVVEFQDRNGEVDEICKLCAEWHNLSGE